ncbi:hypothetical protein BON22_3514 [Cyberlindnera fabianii]|uniref:Uncharacterized protein n=1 Tax=Cyberlindnera fabianii TaxID=36022 RepID=A0A1V2L671_CYBFA|nr:hypothetical protein BON22_3514 [Cyberlindnera fabianii]
MPSQSLNPMSGTPFHDFRHAVDVLQATFYFFDPFYGAYHNLHSLQRSLTSIQRHILNLQSIINRLSSSIRTSLLDPFRH